jgi:membrane protein involved in colicin uptake
VSDHHLTLNAPYQQDDPLEMSDAREASRRMTRIRRDAEAEFRAAIVDRAKKEAAYRQALAEAIVRIKAEGSSSTEATERARGDASVKKALIDFRVAEGMVKAHEERLRGCEGERSQLKSLIDYSARVAQLLLDQEHEQKVTPLGRAA